MSVYLLELPSRTTGGQALTPQAGRSIIDSRNFVIARGLSTSNLWVSQELFSLHVSSLDIVAPSLLLSSKTLAEAARRNLPKQQVDLPAPNAYNPTW
jgi:hypothetical protein